ncbi:hypothetical protein ABZV75_07415 [Streptomyces flaveolus]|uniref:hypothetical protein n=1 Tax=Streptomyces flaveolus TaxID=67297 RepID=UPI0033AFE0CA
MGGTDPSRHHDSGRWLEYTGRVLVVCPGCGGRALAAPRRTCLRRRTSASCCSCLAG